FPEMDPLSLGVPGMHGTAYANLAMDGADLIVCVGARFADRVIGDAERFARKARVIHIDVDPAEIGKVIPVDIPIVGDARQVLVALLEELQPHVDKLPDFSPWHAQIAAWKAEYPLKWSVDGERSCPNRENGERCDADHCGSTACPGRHGTIKGPAVIRALWEATDGRAIVTTDVGQHQMWAMQYYQVREPRQFISSAGLGTMGFGLPAAIGAQLGNPEKEVWCISGDGSLQMLAKELATAVIHHLPIKIALLNNGCLGMVRQMQAYFFGERYTQVGLNVGTPDFVKLAEAYGCAAIRVIDQADIPTAIAEARKVTDRPVLIDFICDAEEMVLPMIPGGKSVAEMILP
ncbi:MAG TPA: thiamine pyrophosphate-dependent enzyme, partial [Armatimonadota bacterium]